MGMQVADLFATLGLKPDEKSWHRGNEMIETIKHGLEIFAGYEAVKWVGELIKSTSEAAIGAGRLAQKLGISAGAVQELGYAASVSGASVEDMQFSLQKFARGLDETITKGSGPAADALARLNIPISELKHESLDQNLEVIAEKFKAMPDGVKKTALAMDLFGRSGTTLIPLLNRGKAGIVDLRNEFAATGAEIDDGTIKSFEELEETQKRLGATWQGIKVQIVSALLPALKDVAEGALAWVKANREVIASTIKVVVQGLVLAIKGLGLAIMGVTQVIAFFQEHAEIAKAVLIALGIIFGVLAIEAAAAWLVGFAPIVGVVAAITGVILLLEDLWQGLTEGKGVSAAVARWIADKFSSLGRSVLEVFRAIGRFFVGVASAIKDAFVSVFDWISDKITWVWDQIKHVGSWIEDHTVGYAKSAYHAVVGGDDDEPVSSPGQAMYHPMTPARSGPAVVYATNNVTINATGTDPQKVVDIAKQQIKQHHEGVMRDADAAAGGDEDQ